MIPMRNLKTPLIPKTGLVSQNGWWVMILLGAIFIAIIIYVLYVIFWRDNDTKSSSKVGTTLSSCQLAMGKDGLVCD